MSASDDVNAYGRQLTAAEIEAKAHRAFVGGMWEAIGRLQLDFLVSRDLRPDHHLLDVGCGAGRAGVHLVRYLEPGRYCGFDINASLIEAARLEIAEAGLAGKDARLLTIGDFDASLFGRRFDVALAHSLFTHLPMNHIVRCMTQVRCVMAPAGRFFATFFPAPEPGYLLPLRHEPGEIVTNYDRDPYHLNEVELDWMAKVAGLRFVPMGAWGHPRGQHLALFTLST